MKRLTVSKKSLLVDGSDRAFRVFIHDFLIFGTRLEAIREGFGALLGLTGTGYTTLMAIAFLQGDDGVGVNAVAKHLHLSGTFITIETAKLVELGFVDKRTNNHDRRRVLLTVSDKGRAAVEKLAAVQAPVNDALFNCLNARDFARLRGLLPRLVHGSEAAQTLLKLLSDRQEAR